MTKELIQTIIKEIIIDVNHRLDVSILDETTNLFDHLGIDSLEIFEVIIKCEKEFNVSINDQETDQIETFGELVDIINKKLEL